MAGKRRHRSTPVNGQQDKLGVQYSNFYCYFIHTQLIDAPSDERRNVSSCAEMATAPAPRKADTSAFLSPFLFSLARRLSVVVVVFEVARGARRAAAGTLALIVRLRLVRLTATILHKRALPTLRHLRITTYSTD